MSSNYKFHNPEGLYFVSFAVVRWLEVFRDTVYKDMFLESLSFCQKHKGMEVHAWCIMPHHVHLVFRSIKGQRPDFLLGDLKRFTSQTIVKHILENSHHPQNDYFIDVFKKEATKVSNVKHHQFWRHDNHPIELWSNSVIKQKINYTHQNPVKAGFVDYAEDYTYSSAKDYAGEKGLLEGVVIF